MYSKSLPYFLKTEGNKFFPEKFIKVESKHTIVKNRDILYYILGTIK